MACRISRYVAKELRQKKTPPKREEFYLKFVEWLIQINYKMLLGVYIVDYN